MRPVSSEDSSHECRSPWFRRGWSESLTQVSMRPVAHPPEDRLARFGATGRGLGVGGQVERRQPWEAVPAMTAS